VQGRVYETLGSERGQESGEGREEEEEDPRRPHLAGAVSAGELAGGCRCRAPHCRERRPRCRHPQRMEREREECDGTDARNEALGACVRTW
jgi:hypothetical protein